MDGILTPLILVGPYGRTGSTVSLYLLATSNQVAMERKYPFECRYLTYLVQWARLLDQSCAPVSEWNFDTIRNEQCLAVGPVPYEQSCLAKIPPGFEPLSKRCLRAAWRECSANFANTILPGAAGNYSVLYYAEKMSEWTYEFVGSIFDTRGLFTLRDPRDVYLSGLAFDKKRGYVAFGPAFNATPKEQEQYLLDFINESKTRLRRILRAFDCESEYVIHYENLMLNFENETEKLGDWLEIEMDPAKVLANTKLIDLHATSSTQTESVAKWKRELSVRENEFFIKQIGAELAELGYEV